MVVSSKFFNRTTLTVARGLLGKFLVRKIGRRKIAGMIIEVEAYDGPHDKASHASRGRTERTRVMFGKSGYWYVYLIYGMYYCLNIVTEKENYPAAVLIRSVEIFGSQTSLGGRTSRYICGPGRVCKYFKIDKWFNEKTASRKTGLWIEDRKIKITPRMIKRGKRIGVEYAGKWKNRLLRYYI